MGELGDVAAVVTGAGRGLGRGIALGLARLGARVGALDIDQTSARIVLDEIEALGGSGHAECIDVTDEAGVDLAVTRCEEQLGGLDLVVNNAGVLSVWPAIDLPAAEWRRVLEVNATGTFLVSRAAARRMIASGTAGSIVSIASVAGRRGDPQLAHYSASKFAVIGLTQSLARELAPYGITANAVCPGLVETQMIDALAAGWAMSVEAMLNDQAIKRPQDPDEIADTIAFLHRSRSITGQAINVDGGTIFN